MEVEEPSTSGGMTATNVDNKDNGSNNSDTKCGSTETTAQAISVEDFLSTGRTGRRNALPDILEEKSSRVNTADLPNQLQNMSFTDSTQHNGSSGQRSESTVSPCSSNQNK